jgi:hypothetical protein
LRDENHLRFFTTLGTGQGEFPVLNIHWPDFQNLSDSHSTPGHKLQHDPIPRLHGSKNDLIHQVLFDNLPLLGRALSKHFPQHCRIAGVLDFGINRDLEEVEEGLQAGVAVAFRGWF